jgi:methylmalonyl-CoA mutase
LKTDFPAVEYQQWRSLVEAQLQGTTFEEALVTPTYEGIDLEPLYARGDEPAERGWPGLPGHPPFVRGPQAAGATPTGWDLRQQHAHPDLHISNQLIHEDVQGGVTSVLLRLDAAARAGLDPDDAAAAEHSGQDGIAAYHWEDLQTVLQDVDLANVPVAIDAGAAFLPAAAQLIALWHQRGLNANRARGALNADPFAALATAGLLPYSVESALSMLADLAAWTHQHCSEVTSVAVDTSAYHHAGATATQDIAIALATGVAYLRAMQQCGLSIDAAARQIQFRMSVDTQLFLSIAKLRAARCLWWQVIGSCGGSPAGGAMRLQVQTGQRVFTRRDPHLNLLRNTIGVLAAAMGGSEIITSIPFDTRFGLPDAFSRRLARNTPLILQDEAHLGWVMDPTGGSWYVEQLTRQIGQEAWRLFQDIQRRGGIMSALSTGLIAAQIEAVSACREQDIAQGRHVITGVTDFVDDQAPMPTPHIVDTDAIRTAAAARLAARRRESPALAALAAASDSAKATIDAAAQGASIGQLSRALRFYAETTTIAPLTQTNLSDRFGDFVDHAGSQGRPG